MRQAVVVVAVLIVRFLPAVASAQQVGDKIVVTTDNASLRSNDATTGTVPKGAILVVKNVNGDWFWVISSGGKTGTVKGWINRSDVIPFSQSLDVFNEELKRNPTATMYYIRGTIWYLKGESDIALADFNEAIRLDPEDGTGYAGRGLVWTRKKEYDKAISDFDEAIRLDPKNSIAYINRGNAWSKKKESLRAISDFGEAIQLDPKDASAYCNRGDESRDRNEYQNAISDLSDAIRLDPKLAMAYNNLAMVYGAASDAKYRDGKKAVENATKACKLSRWKDANILDTLAAAYAEAGDFDAAVKWQKKARDMVPEKLQAAYQSRLGLFKAHKPYRQEVKK